MTWRTWTSLRYSQYDTAINHDSWNRWRCCETNQDTDNLASDENIVFACSASLSCAWQLGDVSNCVSGKQATAAEETLMLRGALNICTQNASRCFDRRDSLNSWKDELLWLAGRDRAQGARGQHQHVLYECYAKKVSRRLKTHRGRLGAWNISTNHKLKGKTTA